MNKILSCIAFAIFAILTAAPAHAMIAVWEADLEPDIASHPYVMVSASHEAVVTVVCGYYFNYEQRMTFGEGDSTLALVQSLYSAGRKDLYDGGMSCDGWAIYGAGDCAC